MSTLIFDYWQQILAVLAFVVWSVRLEAKVGNNSKETIRLEKKMDSIENSRVEQRKEDMENINSRLVEIKADTKIILEYMLNGKK